MNSITCDGIVAGSQKGGCCTITGNNTLDYVINMGLIILDGNITGNGILNVTINDSTNCKYGTINIYSTSNHQHTLKFAGDAAAMTFDGINNTATFSGNEGDGFDFMILSPTKTLVKYNNNVSFSTT